MTPTDTKALAKLSDLLVGCTVVSIDPPDEGFQECIGKFTVQRGRMTTVFHLHATDMGFWTSGEADMIHDVGGRLREMYRDVRQMFDHIADYALYTLEDEAGPESFEAMDDVLLKQIGFKCRKSGKEWWVGLNAIKASPWARDLLSVEQRQDFARQIGENGCIPQPSVSA